MMIVAFILSVVGLLVLFNSVRANTIKKKLAYAIIGLIIIGYGVNIFVTNYESNQTSSQSSSSQNQTNDQGTQQPQSFPPRDLTGITIVSSDTATVQNLLNNVTAKDITDKQLNDLQSGNYSTYTTKMIFKMYGVGIPLAVYDGGGNTLYDYPSSDHKGQEKVVLTFVNDELKNSSLQSLDWSPYKEGDLGYDVLVDDSNAAIFQ